MSKNLPHDPSLIIRNLLSSDIETIVADFAAVSWPKSKELFEKYLDEQNKNERLIWLAFWQDKFAGYVTLKWESYYPKFKERNIPEIMDLNVLPDFRNKGIASKLIAKAEAASKSDTIGIGVGLYDGYGNAQKLYVKKGYVPFGEGVTYNYLDVGYGEKVTLDDDLVLWFTKSKK